MGGAIIRVDAVRLRLMRQVELNVQGSVQRLQHTAATTLLLCFTLEQPRDTRGRTAPSNTA